MSGTINFAIPKGSLEKATFEILERAWYNIYGKESICCNECRYNSQRPYKYN